METMSKYKILELIKQHKNSNIRINSRNSSELVYLIVGGL